MAQNNIISTVKINEAAAGNATLRELLQNFAASANVQLNATNTAAAKNVPPQATGQVSFLQKTYIVEITNPGAVSPTSALQSSQAAASANPNTSTQNVTAIYHQIRCATSPRFDISSNVQTFGGDTGSTQTYWTLSGLGSGRFYFQIRSSYDGVNFNLWRNANGGQSITKGPEGVTVEQVNNAVWGAFELPGAQLCAFGSGFVADGGGFDVATDLYTSAMQVIPGPNGFTPTAFLSSGIKINAIAISTPTDTSGLVGPPDFPAVVAEKYEDGADGDADTWSGSANIFGFAYDPLGTNVKLYSTSTGTWVVFTLPGGAQMAVGSGSGVADQSAIEIPAAMAPWYQFSQLLGIVTPLNVFSNSHHAHGVTAAEFYLEGGLTKVKAEFEDGEGNIWGGTLNWFAVVFSPGVVLESVMGGQFVVFTLPSGSRVAIGSGVVTSGTAFALPAGFTADNTLSIGVPVSFGDTGHAMAGVVHCAVNGLVGTLTYQDGASNFWSGDVGWFCFAWE